MTSKIIVADAGPLIALAKLNELLLLPQIFSEIYVPETVFSEVTLNPRHAESVTLTDFLSENTQINPGISNSFTEELSQALDDGEVQALALAKELNSGVLMDELRGRKLASYHSIPAVGVLGVLIKSKQLGLIAKVSPLLEQLLRENYHLSSALIARVLAQVGES